jgi:hypothetical protein
VVLPEADLAKEVDKGFRIKQGRIGISNSTPIAFATLIATLQIEKFVDESFVRCVI